MKDKIIESFNRIALFEDKWDHNRRYSKLMLKEMGDNTLDKVLDIGCGTGEFTKKVAAKSKSVIGIDISPQMIEEAKHRHPSDKIKYVMQDFDLMQEDEQYDCIVSIATFHHLSLKIALPKVKRLLKPNGVLIVLDLYDRKGIIDIFLDIIAVPVSYIMKKNMDGSQKTSQEEIEAWKEHMYLDKYTKIKDLRNTYSHYLGKDVRIRRLIFWRYIAVYRKTQG